MKFEIKVKTDNKLKNIIKNSTKYRKMIWEDAAQTFHDRCQDYVPWQVGTLQNTATVEADENGGTVTWIQEYAHYQYYGEVMGPNLFDEDYGFWSVPKKEKHYTGKSLTYNGAPMRGKEWDKRMLADHQKEWEQGIQAYISELIK